MTTSIFPSFEVQTDLICRLVTSSYKSHCGEESLVYGVEIIRNSNCDDCAVIHDLSSNKNEVEEFIFRLKQERVAPDRLFYDAVDFLTELVKDD